MNIESASFVRLRPRCIKAIVAASSLCVMLLTLAHVVSAQPAPDPSTPAAPAAVQPSDAWTTAPAAPAVEPTPAAAPASAGASAAPAAVSSTAVDLHATPPAAPAQRDPYTGPPLLLVPSNKKPTLGGYGGLTVAYTRMLHRDGVLIGGEGAMLVEHRLSIGGAGYGFTRTPSGPTAPDGTKRQYFSGYGGFVVRYAVYTDIPLYVSFGVLIGGGAITLAPREHDDGDNHQRNVEARGYFVLQPDASLHVNMTRWLRLSLQAGYRLATGVDTFHFQSDDVGGAVVGGNIQAGWL